MSFLQNQLRYPIKNLSLLLYGIVLFQAGLSKLIEGKTPSWFLTQFENTFLNAFEGSLPLQYFSIAIAEVLIGVLALASLLGLPLLPRNFSPVRFVLVGSSLLFVALCFGLRVTFKFQDAGMCFLYAIAALILVDLTNREAQGL